MDGWNTTFLLGRPIFRGYVSFREGIFIALQTLDSLDSSFSKEICFHKVSAEGQLSNEKTTAGYIGDYTTQLCGDYNEPL